MYPQSSFKDEPLLQLRVLYISFVQGLFAARPKGSYHWEQGEDSEILITDEHPIKGDKVGPRPAVSFTRGPVQLYSLGIDDMLGYNFQTAGKTKAVLVPGVMSVNCCSRVDIESERIAWFVAEHLWLLREMLMGQDRFYEIGRQPQISAPSPAESIVVSDSGDEWYCTTVTSPFQFPRKSQVTPLNREIVNSIDVQIRTQMMKLCARTTGGPAASPSGVDLPLHVEESGPPGFFPEASDVHGRTPDPGGNLPNPPTYAPHPLDPARMVKVRTVHPFRAGLRPLSMGGHTVPIAASCVEESETIGTAPIKVKV